MDKRLTNGTNRKCKLSEKAIHLTSLHEANLHFWKTFTVSNCYKRYSGNYITDFSKGYMFLHRNYARKNVPQ